MWTVYRHTSPSGKVYIGITSHSDVNKRWRYGSAYKTSLLFNKAIQKYGWKNIKHEVLFTSLSEHRAKRLEIALIRHYKGLGISYNITDGGDGPLGCSWTPSSELKTKWSLQRTGRVITQEWRNNISKAMKGKQPSRKVALKGAVIAKALNSIPVLQLTLQGEVIAAYSSITEAAQVVGTGKSEISKCCKGKCKTSKGFVWTYADSSMERVKLH